MSRRRLITGGRVFTADPDRPWADAVVVDGERIAYVGDAETAATEAGEDAERIDADGGLVVPGFVDGHVHVILTGGSIRKAKLMRAGSLEEILRRVRAWAEAHPDEPRVLGTGWLHSDLPDPHPTRQILDAIIPDRPVYLEAHDFHSSWVNSAALAEMGIDRKTPDPPGGEIVRDQDTGEATGHLLEGAHFNIVQPTLANVDDATRDVLIATALEAFASAGITSVVEMALEEPALLAMARARDAGRLTSRIVAHLVVWRTDDPAEELRQVQRAAELRDQYQGDLLRVTGIKIIADGTIDGCTSALSKPYTNGASAKPIWDPLALDPVVCAADAEDLQIAVHAVGDETIRITVDALEKAMRVNETSGRRHRIEHLEYAQPRDIERMGALGITASMQPVHVDPTILEHWRVLLGPERANQAFAWPLHLAAGSTLAFGTDAPTAPHHPMPNMYLASTRKSPTDDSLPALRADWALPLEQALAHGTRESAWAAWLDHVTGMLRPGLAADLVVLDRDPLAEGSASLLATDVKLTMMNGEVVYSA